MLSYKERISLVAIVLRDLVVNTVEHKIKYAIVLPVYYDNFLNDYKDMTGVSSIFLLISLLHNITSF